jgi:RNA polymerase sigma-70 factor (ECF subfamily)
MSATAEISADLSVNGLEKPMALRLQSVSELPAAQSVRCESSEDDFALLRRYAGFGDAQAFAQIVQRYARFVYATCLRVIGDGSRAEDLSQETFFRLMRRPHEVRQNLGGWLHRTATHLALDSLRSETSRRKREIVYSTQCTQEACTWAELSPAVDQALTDMPEESRTLLIEHFLMGKSQAQLAAETGLSASTVSRRMHQALDELRQHLRLKGVYAMPAVLAGLLCHVAARQAPASLVRELGKMAMFSGTTAPARAAQFRFSKSHRPAPQHVISRFISPAMVLALTGMIGALILMQLLGCLWGIHPATRPNGDDQPHLKAKPASAMVIWDVSSLIQGEPQQAQAR